MASTDKYSAPQQGLGYIYQPRLALLKFFQLPEDTAVLIEKDDDLDFLDDNGHKSLASLKHKAEGDRLTDLSTDFWKSVRIWLSRYKRDGCSISNLRFFLYTTSLVSDTSFLQGFLPNEEKHAESSELLVAQAENALKETQSSTILKIADEFHTLKYEEKRDFFERILIFDRSPRIENIPAIIKESHMRSIRREHRDSVFERLEGWWHDITIKHLTGLRSEGIYNHEVSDKLANVAEEYKTGNLPITFRGKQPLGDIDTDNDPRMFVVQLREIGVSSNRIRSAILDYYRAFEQRSEWVRENLIASEDIEDHEERIVDEWNRYKDVVFDELDENSAEDVLLKAGRELYLWADQQSLNLPILRIRERVDEPYITRGSFHILANEIPKPRVYWHPQFLDRISQLLEVNR